MENDKNYKEASLIKNIFTSEVKFIIGIVVFVFGVISPYFGIKSDIALIRNDISNINTNHEAHIQDILQNIKEIQADQLDQNSQIIELQKQVLLLLNKK